MGDFLRHVLFWQFTNSYDIDLLSRPQATLLAATNEIWTPTFKILGKRSKACKLVYV